MKLNERVAQKRRGSMEVRLDLLRAFNETNGKFTPAMSRCNVNYRAAVREASKLVELGLLRRTRVVKGGFRDRAVYEVTEKGYDTLSLWDECLSRMGEKARLEAF